MVRLLMTSQLSIDVNEKDLNEPEKIEQQIINQILT